MGMAPIQLTEDLAIQLEELTEWIETEVAGFLTGEIVNGIITLDGLIIPEQKVSGGDVEFEADDLLKLRTSMTDAEWKRVLGHWHSHNSMGCFWSPTDDELIKQFSKGRKKSIFIVSSTRKGGKGNTASKEEVDMLCNWKAERCFQKN